MRFRPILRRLLLALDVLLILVTIVLLILWRQAAMALSLSGPTTGLCTGTNIPLDLPPSAYPQCGPTAAEIALPGEYAHATLATGAAGVGCLIGTYVLGRRSKTR